MQKYNLPDQKRNDSFDGKEFQLIRNGSKDITNTNILIEFKYGSEDGPVKLRLKVGEGITKTDALEGLFAMDAIEKVTLEVGTYYYDIKFIDGPKRKSYMGGIWKITQD